MDAKRDTISRINEKFNKMSKSHKKLATFVIDHYEQAAFMTAAKLGKAVGISEATVVRFAYGLAHLIKLLIYSRYGISFCVHQKSSSSALLYHHEQLL